MDLYVVIQQAIIGKYHVLTYVVVDAYSGIDDCYFEQDQSCYLLIENVNLKKTDFMVIDYCFDPQIRKYYQSIEECLLSFEDFEICKTTANLGLAQSAIKKLGSAYCWCSPVYLH